MPHACTNCGRTFPDGSKEMLSGCPDCGGNKFRYHPDAVEDDTASSDRAPPDPDDEGLPGRDQGVVDRATTTVREWVGTRSTPDGDGTPSPDARPPASADAETPAGPTTGSSDDAAEATPSDGHTGATGADAPAEADSPSEPAPTATEGTDATAVDPDDTPEDTAQADARTGVADPAEIPDTTPDDGSPDLAPAEERAAAVAGAADDRGDTDAAHSAEPADPTATPAASNLAQLREELNEQFESIKIVEPGEYELNLMELYDREEYIISLMEDGRYAIEVPETWRDSEDLPDE